MVQLRLAEHGLATAAVSGAFMHRQKVCMRDIVIKESVARW